MKDQNDINTFPDMMMVLGAERRITTPSYAEFIELLTNMFDLHWMIMSNKMRSDKMSEGNKMRPDKMSESRSMSAKQDTHEVMLREFFLLFGVTPEGQTFLRSCFLKIENMLLYFKSNTICSSHSASFGEFTFLKLVAFPQVLALLYCCCKKGGMGFSCEMLRYLGITLRGGMNEKDCLQLLKKDIDVLLKHHGSADFQIWLGKLDTRSFPKLKTIEEVLKSLRCDISIKINCDNASIEKIITGIRFALLAAKAAFKVIKLFKDQGFSDELSISLVHLELHIHLCKSYVCKEGLTEYNYDYIQNENFVWILNHFKHEIGHAEYEIVPAEIAASPASLIRYKNSAFLPWCVYSELMKDLGEGCIDKAYINNFEKAFLFTAKNYQYGELAVSIASVLLAMKVKIFSNLPYQSLEPLAMELMRNGFISNEIALCWNTPFGLEDSFPTHTSNLYVAKAISLFNEHVRSKEIQEALCNPLEGLNEILHCIFDRMDKGDVLEEGVRFLGCLTIKRPVKTLDLDVYDALKMVNRLLGEFGLVELTSEICYGNDVKTSLAGDFINRYLALESSEKIEILRKIDPKKCQADRENAMRSRTVSQ